MSHITACGGFRPVTSRAWPKGGRNWNTIKNTDRHRTRFGFLNGIQHRSTKPCRFRKKTLRLYERSQAAGVLDRPLVDWTVSHRGSPCFDAQPSEVPGYGDQRYPISPNFMGSIPRSFRRPRPYSRRREPFHGLRKLRTTAMRHFPARKKLSKKPRWETPSGLRVHAETQKTSHAES